MSATFMSVRQLQQRIERIKADIAALGPMRPGSLVEHYRRCGKPTCRCAKPGQPGHGPQWLLTRAVAGKTVSVPVGPQALERTRCQVEEYRRFRALARELIEHNARLCEALLRAPQAASDEAAKKGASQRLSRRRSSPRSRRSSGRAR